MESEKTIEGIFVDVGEAIDVGNEHGVFVGVDHMIGLRQFSESYYGVDIMTFDKIDPLDKIADGSGRFGGTTGLFTGIAGGIRSWINPKPVNVATVLTENLQKNMKPNVAAEVTQQTAKPLVHSEVVAPKYPADTIFKIDTFDIKNNFAVDPKFIRPDGKLIYPSNNGAVLGTGIKNILDKGNIISRFGDEFGTYASPKGTPFHMRSLPPSKYLEEHHLYEVLRPLYMDESIVAPWFDQPGLSKQYKFNDSILILIQDGYLKRIK